jgi:hypothetical protein
VASDHKGRYAASGLPPGLYRIEVAAGGFRREVRTGIQLEAGRNISQDFRLTLGEARETVEVSAAPPLISVSVADWGRSIPGQKLKDLPLKGRDLLDLIAREPGATVSSSAAPRLTTGLGTRVGVNGARPGQSSYRLDGVYINDWTGSAPSGASGRLLGLESVQEVRLVSSPFSAEYGRSAGSLITAVSRSGTNTLHGSAYDYFRNEALDAKNFFNLAGERIPPLRSNQFGGLASGPLRRDRLFFLLNYEAVREQSSRSARALTLTDAARQGRLPGGAVRVAPEAVPYLNLYPRPTGIDFVDGSAEYYSIIGRRVRQDFITAKSDWAKSERWRSAVRYTLDASNTNAPDAFQLWRFLGRSRNQFAQAETHLTPSATALHSFRAGFSSVRNGEFGALRDDIPAAMSFLPGQPMGAIQVTGLESLGGLEARSRPRQFVLNDYQFSHDSTLMRGPHSIRMGSAYNRTQFNQVSDLNSIGYYVFNSIAALLQARPTSGDLMQPGSDSVRRWRMHLAAGFLQDDWRLSRRLNFSFGLRYEFTSTPSEVNGKIAVLRNPSSDVSVSTGGPLFENPAKTNFAPRAAVAWDPSGAGRTVFRAGAGIFFDLLGTRELVISGNRMPPYFNRLTAQNPLFPDLLRATQLVTPNVAPDGIDYDLQQPYVAQFQFALQRQLSRDSLVEAGYSGARGVHIMGSIADVNSPVPVILPDGGLFFPPNSPRINPNFGQIGLRRTQFNSFYHGLTLRLQSRLRRDLRFDLRYNWAKSIDETSTVIFSDFVNSDRIPNVFDYRQNRGLSDFDVRHAFSSSFSWQIPGGWEIHGILHVQSGHPFNPRIGFDRAGLRPTSGDGGQRPNLAAGPRASIVLGGPDQYFDPGAFSAPPAGRLGNLGRNVLAGPGIFLLDTSLHKTLWRTEKTSLHLRVEMFNIANHPNFQIPSGLNLFNSALRPLGSAGRITETSTPSRQAQLALRWMF